MDPKRVYAADPKPAPARKLSANLKPINDDAAFTEASGKLRYLESGLAQIQNQIDAFRIESVLAHKPSGTRSTQLRERLSKLKTQAPPVAEQPSSKTNEPAAVTAALELLRGGQAPRRLNRAAAIRELEDQADLVGEAIGAQTGIVDEIRASLSEATARRLVETHRKLILAQFRSAQQLAAATDALQVLRNDLTAAGYTWRSDLLPEPRMRAPLMLGSETVTHECEITRTRRLLEEWKIL